MSNPNAATRNLLTQDPDPNPTADHRVPLHNLSLVRTRMDSLQQFLSKSINTNTFLTNDQITTVSNDIVSAIRDIIVNGAALVSYSQNLTPAAAGNFAGNLPDPPEAKKPRFESPMAAEKGKQVLDLKIEVPEDDDVEDCDDDCEIVELDAMEILAENIHFCEVCGKGFRRDANLRMHMRAHGNQFKTVEALAKPLTTEEGCTTATRRRATTRFSCPFEGCNRNKLHKKFKPLKSLVCVKNHFKRSHCPKMYSCNRCHKKNFSVLSDLRSHMKQCGESKWKCSCGTTFSRKDKLFGHIALFEGHMPALAVDQEEKGKKVLALEEEDEDTMLIPETDLGNCFLDDGFPEGFFDDLDKLDSFTSLGFPLI